MKIEKALNNNVAIIIDGGEEKIVMGKGIAFSKHKGDEIRADAIDKTFVLSSPDSLNQFAQLLKDIPYEYVTLAQEIIAYAKTTLGKKLDEKINIDLTDHIYTAVKRLKDGIVIKNALLWDIQRFYQDEYTIGTYALDMIEKKFGVRLPDDEAGFIALHIVNAELSEGNLEDIYAITQIMQEIMNIIRRTFNKDFDQQNVYYYRFMTHLRFFAQRLINKTTYQDEDDMDLFEMIKKKYPSSYKCTERIKEFVKNRYHYDISGEEEMYLTIHIERLVYKS
ncbi:BglG family transcription antiterminator LicT [Sharpea azabuensis]|uniref:BglG family transcription antiterminator LicT n=1 Tax=Sharpea azabuensis TaxID=322505 RepID=UPI001569909C|nr:PRD domain-containing protein [Sharpea azabuensis]